MKPCDEFRGLAALHAAGALSPEESSRLAAHVAACSACAAEREALELLAQDLKRLPTPQPSAGLAERTRVRVERQWIALADRRREYRAIAFLMLFAWTLTIAGWPLVRLFTRGAAGWIDPVFDRTWVGLLVYTALAWLTGGVAAIAVALRQRREGRLA